MNIKNFKKILPVLLKHDVVPFVWGNQGVGKTQSIGQVAKPLDMGFIHLHLATQEVGDLVGLLTHGEDGTVRHSRPEWFPTSGSGIVFLDELNRAHPDVIQAMFSFITSKSIHRHVLPPGWKIVAAGNYQSDQFNVTDTSDAAWMSRFCHLHLAPTAEEFVLFAESKGANTVADFVSEHPLMLESKSKENTEVHVTPDRRAWLEMVAPLENEEMDDEIRYEVYSGIVGASAASAFVSHKKANQKRVRLADILKSYDKVKDRISSFSDNNDTRFDMLSASTEELVAKLEENPALLTEDGIVELQKFFLDLPLEHLSQIIKKLAGMSFSGKDKLLNNKDFNVRLYGKRKL